MISVVLAARGEELPFALALAIASFSASYPTALLITWLPTTNNGVPLAPSALASR